MCSKTPPTPGGYWEPLAHVAQTLLLSTDLEGEAVCVMGQI